VAGPTGGIVYLVGAGPGDPGLLTVRGAELLERADVVVYDALSNPRLLSYCPRAETIYVGKQAAAHSMSQEQIDALLVDLGRAGKRVVRLKGGDPFVFGRGGEECEALAAAGVPFEVVPGITAAIGAAAYAGIPVTHRDFNSSFTFITGHEKEDEYKDPQAAARGAAAGSSDLDWGAIAKLPCLAFYMGVKSVRRICEKLVAHGMDPQMPAAMIQSGTTVLQRTVVGTVRTLAEDAWRASITPPALVIIGKVVSLRSTLNWFERRPLFKKTVVVTRSRQQASELSERLTALGAFVIEAPTIELAPPADWGVVDRELARAAEFDWVVFTSANGVEYARRRLMEIGRDVRVFGAAARFAAVGDATARAIEERLCVRADLCPSRFVAEALADELETRGEIPGKRFLLLRADIARPILRERLEKGGAAEVRDVAVYETKPVGELPPGIPSGLELGFIDWVTFTSSSTVRNFVGLLDEGLRERLRGVKIASIGPITTQTLKELGLQPRVEAEQSNIDGLVQAMLKA
jgi:uroporphyrinogen III methyltransferase/synthase